MKCSEVKIIKRARSSSIKAPSMSPLRLSSLSPRPPRRSSTRPSSCTSSSALTPATLTSSAIVLPNGTGKSVKVLVFCKPEREEECKEAGADYVGGMELVQKIQGENWFDFDVVIASPDMMGVVGRLGKVLGPKGLMPSPKAGTVTPNLAQAIKESKAGKIEYRLDKTNIIHCPIGKASFGAEKLLENYTALITAILRAKPATAKGQYIRSCVTATTMGPGIKINAQKQL